MSLIEALNSFGAAILREDRSAEKALREYIIKIARGSQTLNVPDDYKQSITSLYAAVLIELLTPPNPQEEWIAVTVVLNSFKVMWKMLAVIESSPCSNEKYTECVQEMRNSVYDLLRATRETNELYQSRS